MKVVIAGGAGALGRRLCDDLHEHGHEVVVLTRRSVLGGSARWSGTAARSVPGAPSWKAAPWSTSPASWSTADRHRRTSDCSPRHGSSRRALSSRRVAPSAQPVPVWVQASTLAIYGDAGDNVLDETAPAAQGPAQMAGVATAWEASVAGANTDRLVVLRTGIVLDRDSPGTRQAPVAGPVGARRPRRPGHAVGQLDPHRRLARDRPYRRSTRRIRPAMEGVMPRDRASTRCATRI